MKQMRLRVWIGWLLILISLLFLLWGLYPFEAKRREMRIFPHDMQLPGLHEVFPSGLRWT